LNYRKIVWPIVTHALVAVLVYVASYYAFGFLAIGAAVNKCGTDTDTMVARNAAGEKVGMNDSVCGLIAPGHNAQIYRVGADGTRPESIAHYSTDTFLMPHASWTPDGQLVLDVPRATSLSTDPYVSSIVTIKFGRVR